MSTQPANEVIISQQLEVLTEETKQAAQAADHAPEDIAAAFFQMQYPKFQSIVERLSFRALKRLIVTCAAYPLVPREYKVRNDEEKQALYLFSEMVQNKMIMQLAFEQQKVSNAMENNEDLNPSLIKGEETKLEGEE